MRLLQFRRRDVADRLHETSVVEPVDPFQRRGIHVIQAILAGKQPRCMSLLWFQRNPLAT